jgi:hypothetical protein
MKLNHPNTVAALVRLHSELGGRILANRKEAKSLATDMKHVEAVIRMFDPGYDVRRIAVRRRNRTNGLFKRGTLFRAALDTLRKAPEPVTTRELSRPCWRLVPFLSLLKSSCAASPSRCRASFGTTTEGLWSASEKACRRGGH